MSLLLLGAIALAQAAPAPQIVQDARPWSGSISSDDYPRSEWRRRIGGITVVRMLVNEGGRLAACEVTESSGNAKLDAIPCRVLQRRFRFKPARDSGGRAVAQWLGLRWKWDPKFGIDLGNPSFSPER